MSDSEEQERQERARLSRVYWEPIVQAVGTVRPRVRMCGGEDPASFLTDWGTLFILPTDRYLEVSEGPCAISRVRWVELCATTCHGGRAGRPLTFQDIEADLVVCLEQTAAIWEVCDAVWTFAPLFEDRPVRAVRIKNPFWRGLSGRIDAKVKP